MKIPFKNTSNPKIVSLKDIQRWRSYKANVIHTSCKPLTKGTRARFISTAVKKVDRYGKRTNECQLFVERGFLLDSKLLSEVCGCLCSIVWRKR